MLWGPKLFSLPMISRSGPLVCHLGARSVLEGRHVPPMGLHTESSFCKSTEACCLTVGKINQQGQKELQESSAIQGHAMNSIAYAIGAIPGQITKAISPHPFDLDQNCFIGLFWALISIFGFPRSKGRRVTRYRSLKTWDQGQHPLCLPSYLLD